MSLIKCPVCEQQISDQAPTCIKCGHPMGGGGEPQGHLSAAWSAVTRSRTPVNVFSLAMMACAAVLGFSATQIDNQWDLVAFTYTLHTFLAVSGMFFVMILFSRKGMYHPEDLAKAKQSGVDDLGKDSPVIAAVLIVGMLAAYGVYQWLARAGGAAA